MYVRLIDGVASYYTITDLRRDNPDTSFPIFPSDDALVSFNVYPCQSVEQPTVDYTKTVSLGDPVLSTDGWVQVWNISDATSEEIYTRVEECRNSKLREVKQNQAAVFNNGFTFDFGLQGIHSLDMRNADDKANWTLLLIKTQSLITTGMADSTVTIRTAQNEIITVSVTIANQAITAILSWCENILNKKWTLDEAIKLAPDMESLTSINTSFSL